MLIGTSIGRRHSFLWECYQLGSDEDFDCLDLRLYSRLHYGYKIPRVKKMFILYYNSVTVVTVVTVTFIGIEIHLHPYSALYEFNFFLTTVTVTSHFVKQGSRQDLTYP